MSYEERSEKGLAEKQRYVSRAGETKAGAQKKPLLGPWLFLVVF
jgi:hypothetical protein